MKDEIKSYPKKKPYRNRKYLDWIRSRPCIFCGGLSEPHHVRRYYWGSGTGQKPHDYVCIPVCRTHHDAKLEMDICINKVIIRLIVEYIRETRDDIEFIDCLMKFIDRNS